MHCAGIPFVIVNSLCGALVAYGLAGLRLTAHALIINLCITALQSMISIQLQVRCRFGHPPALLAHTNLNLSRTAGTLQTKSQPLGFRPSS